MRTLFSTAALSALFALSLPALSFAQGIDFGDNTSTWANDGECDDPRFENTDTGNGMATTLLEADRMHDANDCRSLYNLGLIRQATENTNTEICESIQYGSNDSQWADDGECDDPRFTGVGMASSVSNNNAFKDASDCRMLCMQGLLTLKQY